MLIHHYSSTTGEYLSSGQPDADPQNDGRWLIPANATFDAPPERTPTSWPFYRDGAWFLLPDYRGRICYRTDTGEPVEIAVAGKTPDELGLTTEPRPSARHAWVDGAWAVPAAVIEAEKEAAVQQTFDMLMTKAKKANEGKADAYAAGQLDAEGIYYFKAWAAYQMALVGAMDAAAGSPDAIVWPAQPAPYVAPAAAPDNTPAAASDAAPAATQTQTQTQTQQDPAATAAPQDAASAQESTPTPAAAPASTSTAQP
ncbi:tail fiber assembly protein [Burkholderia sp. Ac-20379]|uniref:tail fiber assembly protein n=1 Tax=Burkholderia sp. Ac-20379 TaxID=2703900 RepID=UPI00197FA0F4|nr:tail fiber assembly protein [Burkholderia sp. Ac-20379]MBN3725630.1 tail assembly chaperone [Burkholderia sp. Ac-20379]